jgi:membrane fusion protein, copper/silver efflux system
MNSHRSSALRRSRIVSIALAALVVVVAVVFRGPLSAWFTGKSMSEGPSGIGVAGASGAGHASSAMLQSVEYPPAAVDALHSAMDAYERIRSELARDSIQKLPEASHNLAEALRAAGAAVPPASSSAVAALRDAASHADTLEMSKSLDDARHAFAAVNLELLPALAADSRLVAAKHLFECSMFDHARWMQAADTAANPYMGSKMPTCGTVSSWQGIPTTMAAPASGSAAEIDHYTCSMHPSVRQAGPGKCPICGMDLIPVTKEQQSEGVVMIDEGRRQLIGVRTSAVIEAPLRSSFHAVGHIAYDESALTDVNLKVKGWITKLLVNETGQRVARGQTLFTMYSPELYNAEQDFLLASRSAPMGNMQDDAGAPRVASFARAARKRLNLLGLSDAQIDAVSTKGEPLESTAIASPASGFVIEKDVVEGAMVDAGMRLFRIAALNKVWVEADVYEADLAHVGVGQPAKVTLDYLPGRAYEAKVSYVYPYLEMGARTGRVRIELANTELELRPGMYASVELASDMGSCVQVPASAIVYTGPRRLVFVDLGEGRFRPQEVHVGTEADGMYEVLNGLKAGDMVATSGVFLIAAEARISTAAKYWDSGPENADGGVPPAMDIAQSPMPLSPMAPPAPRQVAHPAIGQATPPSTTTAKRAAPAAGFTCPMHPSVKVAVPGKCPICGMDLVPSAGGANP